MSHLHPFAFSIDRQQREKLLRQRAHVLWLTGLSGSGKSTVADRVEQALFNSGFKTFILDGDHLRGGLCKDLGFSAADRAENIRRAGAVSRLLWESGLVVITTFVSPFRHDRDQVRQLFPAGAFSEIYLDAGLAICEQRDPKGLYRKAREGTISDMTGIDSPYEEPLHPELRVKTGQQSPGESADQLLRYLIPIITKTV